MKYSCKNVQTKNGTPLLLVDVPDTKNCEIAIAVRSGYRVAYRDDTTKYETPHILEHLVFEGSDKYPTSDELQDVFTKGGSESNGLTSPYHNIFVFHTRGTRVKEVLSAAFDMVYRPLLEQKGFDEELAVVRNELEDRMGDLAGNASLFAQMQMVPNSTMATDMQLGLLENNTLDDVKKYHETYYTQANTQIIITMDFRTFTQKDIIKLIETLFDGVPIGERCEFPVYDLEPSTSNATWVPIGRSIHDAILSLQFAKPGASTHRQRLAMNMFVALANNMKTYSVNYALRKKGLVYGLNLSGFDSMESSGLELELNVRNEKLPEVLANALERLRILGEEGVSDTQFESLRQDVIDSYADAIESSGDIMRWYLEDYLIVDTISHPEEDIKLLKKITQPEVLEVIKEIIRHDRMYATVFSSKPKRVSGVVTTTVEAVLRDKKPVTEDLINELAILLPRPWNDAPFRIVNIVTLFALGLAFTLPAVDLIFKSPTIAHMTYDTMQYWMIAGVFCWVVAVFLTLIERTDNYRRMLLGLGAWGSLAIGTSLIFGAYNPNFLAALNTAGLLHAGIVLLCMAILIVPNISASIQSLRKKTATEISA